MKRIPEFETQWMEQVARSAQRWGHSPERFFDEVRARLQKGADEYGPDSWSARPLLDLIREAAEEGADVPGWLVLAAQKLNAVTTSEFIDDEQAMLIQQRLIRASALGLQLHEELRQAEHEWRTLEAEAKWRAKQAVPPPPIRRCED